MDFKRPQTKKAKEKFEKIIAAADQEFFDKGYEKASIANITAAANMAVGTFYLYFKDKLSLYHYILFDYQDRIKRYINARIGNCQNRYEKERVGLMAWLEFINENPHTYNIIWQSLFIDKTLFKDYYSKFAASYKRGLQKDADQLIDIDYETLAFTLMGTSSFLGLKTLIYDGEKLSQEEIERMTDSVMKILGGNIFTK